MPQAAGVYDLYVLFVERYHWPPDVVDALDPDILDELLTAIKARFDHEALEARRHTRGRRSGGGGGSGAL